MGNTDLLGYSREAKFACNKDDHFALHCHKIGPSLKAEPGSVALLSLRAYRKSGAVQEGKWQKGLVSQEQKGILLNALSNV